MNRFQWLLLTLLLGTAPAFAGTLTYTCATAATVNTSSTAGALPSSACTMLTTIASQYAAVFTNVTAAIYVEENSSSGGDVAFNTQAYNSVSYQSYYVALKSHELAGWANDTTAVASLPSCTSVGGGGASCVNPVVTGYTVALPGPLENALGLGTGTGICTSNQLSSGCTDSFGSYGTCSLGTFGCYNDIIDVASSGIYFDSGVYVPGEYDFFTAVEHETNEALGTASGIENTTGTPATAFGTAVTAADLFRYSSKNTHTFTSTATGSLAYFSINSGATDIVPYNNTNNGGDYGDFSTNCAHVQDVDGCSSRSGIGIENDGGVEIALLDAVGYNLTATGKTFDDSGVTAPEPSSIVMALAGIGAIGLRARRRSARSV